MRRNLNPRFSVLAATYRRPVACLAILALLAAPAGRVLADDEPLDSIVDLARLTVISTRLMARAKAVQGLGLYGFAKQGHCLFGASLAPKETATMRLTLTEDEDCLWFGAGDGNCQDLDIKVVGPDGLTLATDVGRDAVPCVRFTATKTGEHVVKLSLFKGTGTSFCSLVMMQRNGWNIPFQNLGTAIGEFVAIAARTAGTVDDMSRGRLAVRLPEGGTGWCLFGTVMERGGTQSVLNLAFGQGPRVFISAGCSQATDIDLEVTDQDTKEAIATDKQSDATPVGLGTTAANTLYTVCTSLPESRGAALTLTGVLRIEMANAARTGIQPAMAW